MATLRQVEKFTLTFSGLSQTKTLSTTLLDTSKAFLVFGIEETDNEPKHGHVRGEITNTTTLTFARNKDNLLDVEIVGYVVEFTEGVTVQRGIQGLGGFTSSDVTLTSIDLSKSFRITSIRKAGNAYGGDDFVKTRLWDDAGTKKIRFETADTSNASVAWQVIEYDDCSVQRGLVSIAVNNDDVSDTITAVNRSKAWLLSDFATASGSPGFQANRGQIDSTTSLLFEKGDASSSNVDDISWEVVEFTDNTTVKQLLEYFVNNDFEETQTFTALSGTDRAFAIASGAMGRTGKCEYTGDDYMGNAWFTFNITSTTGITIKRGRADDTGHACIYLIDFGAAAIELTVGDSKHALKSQNTTLTQAFNIASNDSKSVLKSENIALEQSHALTIDNSKSLLKSQNAVVEQINFVSADNSKLILKSAAPVLTIANTLIIGDSKHTLKSQQIDLTQSYLLFCDNSKLTLKSTAPVLVESATLTITGSKLVVSSENILLAAAATVAVAAARLETKSNNVTVIEAGLIATDSSQLALKSQNAALSQAAAVNVANSRLVTSSENVTLDVGYIVNTADSKLQLKSNNIELTAAATIAVSASHLQTSSQNTNLSVFFTLSVDNSKLVLKSEQSAITAGVAVDVGDSRFAIKSAAPILLQAAGVTVGPSRLQLKSTAPAVNEAGALVVGNSSFALKSDQLALTQSANLIANGSKFELKSETLSLTQFFNLTVGASHFALKTQQPTTTVSFVLVAGNSKHELKSDNTQLTPFYEAAIDQKNFRFRNDDGSESAATWKAAQDTSISVLRDMNIRLRFLIDATSDPDPCAFVLEYKEDTESQSQWRKVQT